MRKDTLIPIRGDVFDIADRIREVDARYLLFYNKDKSRYEVRLKGREDEIALSWTESLDARLIRKLRETHVRRVKELLREIEESEERMRKREEHEIKEQAGEMTEGFMSLAWKTRG